MKGKSPCLDSAYSVLKTLPFRAFPCFSIPLGAFNRFPQLSHFPSYTLVVPAGIEPASPASETGALSIELRDRAGCLGGGGALGSRVGRVFPGLPGRRGKE